MDTPSGLTFGEHLRRLRRAKRWNLQQLATETGLSTFHLSRLENDSAVPRPDSVVRLANALGGDLKVMLELAQCLPPEILARLARRASDSGSAVHRSAGAAPAVEESLPSALVADMDPQLRRAVAAHFGLPEDDLNGIFGVLQRLGEMSAEARKGVLAFLGIGSA